MGTKTLLNASSSPPIPYKRYSNKCEEQKPLQQQNSYQQQEEQYTENNNQSNNINTTCLLVKQHTNTMFTKLRNYFTKFRTSSTTISATQRHYTQQQQRKSHSNQHYRHEKLKECNSISLVQSTSNILNIICVIVTLVILASINGVTSSPVFVDNPSLAQFQSGRNIRHLPCIVRKSGRSGVCMFAIDCIKQNGTHLGTCIDRFYFGSCCDIKEEVLSEIADNSIDQNTISHHFTPESSTVPTSALFKLTTQNLLLQHGNISITTSSSTDNSNISSTLTQQDVTQMLNSVTQNFASSTLSDTLRPSTLLTSISIAKPTKSTTTTTTTTKSSQQTTHKHSHFVIRTTAKPNKYTPRPKPVPTTATKKKITNSGTTHKTTTSAATTTTTKPMLLTTAEQIQQTNKLSLEATTPPTKLFTYQIVETTGNTATEITNSFDFVTTERIQHETATAASTITGSSTTATAIKATATNLKDTTTRITEATTTTHKTTTIKPKPQTTRKATTTKKPISNKRTTVKSTKRPTTTISTTTTATPTDLKIQANNTIEIESSSTGTTSQMTTTIQNKTTLAPRPRPKPTASIVKVPKPTTTTTIPTTISSSTKTTTAGATTEADNIAFTTPSSTTKQPKPPTTQSTVTTTTTTSATFSKTTETVTHKPILTSTTHKPGLVTWTNIDGEPVDPNQPLISDWVPVTSMVPPNIHNKVEDPFAENGTSAEIGVSVSSSISAVVNNATVLISSPNKPTVMLKPTNNTSTSSTINLDGTKTTLNPLTSTSAVTEQIETTTTFKPSLQLTTEGFILSSSTSPSSVSTEEVTTEYPNLNSTTISSTTGLEGVDYRQICGRRMFPEPRVVGGSNAAFGRWPWQISLRQWRTSTYLHKCGAALLNENWAITAAHCVDNVPPSDLLLRLGEYDLAEEEEPYGYQERRVQIVASHPQFDPRTFEYDLALLRFYEPVVFQPNIIPVCVPENDEDFIGQTAFVTGWGRLYEDGPLPSVLQEVAVPVINNTICESMYRAAGYIEHIPHIFICAGWKKGGYDSCEGDSGGPMVLQRESDKRFQLGGVISWGIGCAEANQPGVYTRISEFRDWINQILQF